MATAVLQYVEKIIPDPARIAVNARGIRQILSSHLTQKKRGRLAVRNRSTGNNTPSPTGTHGQRYFD